MKWIINLLFVTTLCFKVISGNSILQELQKLNQYSQVRILKYVIWVYDNTMTDVMFSSPTF